MPLNSKLYIDYLDEILLLNEKKENFFCASKALLMKIEILEKNLEEESLFKNFNEQFFEEDFSNSIGKFSYKSCPMGKKEKKLYVLV